MKPLDLDALQAICDAGDVAALRRIVPALIAELREARASLAKLPHHCGNEACRRPIEPDSVLCGCNCIACTTAEHDGIYAHEAST